MIDADEVAKILGISRGAVYDLAAPKGPIPCARFGRRCIRFNVEDIESFKRQHMHQPAPPAASTVRSRLPTLRIKVSSLSARANCFERLGIVTKPKLKPKKSQV